MRIYIKLRNNYFSLGIEGILHEYFHNHNIQANFIDEVNLERGADILFCDASPYNPQLACAMKSKYRRVIFVESNPRRKINTPGSCGCEDAILNYKMGVNVIIQLMDEILFRPMYKIKNCRASYLSKRERQILYFFYLGFTPQKMADALLISSKTLSAHKANAMIKLNITNSIGLYYWLIQNGVHLLPAREKRILLSKKTLSRQ